MIEVSPPPSTPALAEALTEACTAASTPRRCELGDAPAAGRTAARAVWVSPDEVDVEVLDAEHRRDFRRLVFRPNDPAEDRFRALGLFVAAIAGNREVDPHPAEQQAPPAAPADLARKAAPRETAAWLSVGVLGGRGLAPGPPRYGAWLHAGYEFPRFPVFVSGGLEHAVAARDETGLRPSFTAIGAGVGLVLQIRPLDVSLRPRVEVLVEREAVDVFDSATDRSDAGSRWVPGTGAGLELTWPAHAPVSVLLGTNLGFLSGGTAVHIGRDYSSSFPPLSYEFSFGLEVSGRRSARTPE